jgi:release factor glutamine methyltransferase
MVKNTQKTTLSVILREAKNDLLLMDIYLLLGHAIGKGKEFIHTYPEYSPTPAEIDRWGEYQARRLKGEPVSYITGIREFYSLDFKVNRSTLIPRPETELLVDHVLLIRPSSVLDVGTGCGNIAVSVKYNHPGCAVTAVDISPEALLAARHNADRLLGKHDIRFIESNYFSSLIKTEFDVIVSNPPYIKSGDIERLPEDIGLYEPPLALDGGPDGLRGYNKIIEGAGTYLTEQGKILLELDPKLLDGVAAVAEKNDFCVDSVIKDLGRNDRVVVLSRN